MENPLNIYMLFRQNSSGDILMCNAGLSVQNTSENQIVISTQRSDEKSHKDFHIISFVSSSVLNAIQNVSRTLFKNISIQFRRPSKSLDVTRRLNVISTERIDEKSQSIQYFNLYLKPLLVVFIFIGFTLSASAQKQEVEWLTFSELETALAEKPKKVLIHFYADWCTYCHKMEKAVYTKADIVEELSNTYYAVKFNVETQDTIQFGGKTFVNKAFGKTRNPVHQIPEFLAGRKDKDIALPATVLLNEDFEIEQRFYRYISPKEMLQILKDN